MKQIMTKEEIISLQQAARHGRTSTFLGDSHENIENLILELALRWYNKDLRNWRQKPFIYDVKSTGDRKARLSVKVGKSCSYFIVKFSTELTVESKLIIHVEHVAPHKKYFPLSQGEIQKVYKMLEELNLQLLR